MLTGDVRCDHRQVLLVVRRDVESPGPFEGAGDSLVGAISRNAFRQTKEITHPPVRAVADQNMYVVTQNGTPQHHDWGSTAGTLQSNAHILSGLRVHASHSLPSMPRDVGIQLVSVVAHEPRVSEVD